jgi:dynein heavy chain
MVRFFVSRLSSLPTYYVPKDGSLQSYKEFVNMMPNVDHPEAFGQHPNGDIASQIKETRLLFDTLLSLQPQVTSGSKTKKSTEDEVFDLAAKVLESLPKKIDYESTLRIMAEDHSPLKIVLLQEVGVLIIFLGNWNCLFYFHLFKIERYNLILDDIEWSLKDLQKGIRGLVVMSSDLEEIYKCIFEARVPPSWQKVPLTI